MICKVTKLAKPFQIDAKWDKPPWRLIEAESIRRFMGREPEHQPKTEFKIAYDNRALYLIFRVEDQYVRAIASCHQTAVCGDSCVEFFFTPGPDTAPGYFNLEMNCGGTLLFRFQRAPGAGWVELPASAFHKMTIAHSLPAQVQPELQDPVTWTVEYRLPLDILTGYCQLVPPAPEVKWRSNFYKCADQTSHPHWLTWAPVLFPRPQFHLPEFFGILEFQ